MRAVKARARRPVSRWAPWAMRAVLMAIALLVATIPLHRIFGMPTPVALNLFALSFVLAALAILIALIALARLWFTGARGSGLAGGAILLALGVLAWPGAYLPRALGEPPLNDVTTDTAEPPQFVEVAKLRPLGAHEVAYNAEADAEIQAELYPDIRPLVVARPAPETFELVVQALRRLGFEIVAEQEPGAEGVGRVEAVATSLIIGFRDDVVVRITGRAGRSKIDVRSASRFGAHDFGANARRVRQVIREILARLQASVPRADQ